MAQLQEALGPAVERCDGSDEAETWAAVREFSWLPPEHHAVGRRLRGGAFGEFAQQVAANESSVWVRGSVGWLAGLPGQVPDIAPPLDENALLRRVRRAVDPLQRFA